MARSKEEEIHTALAENLDKHETRNGEKRTV